MPLDLICLDADDTLWGHESFFKDAARRYHALLAPFAATAHTQERMDAAEERNLHIYGYGVKGFHPLHAGDGAGDRRRRVARGDGSGNPGDRPRSDAASD